jgi:hypothetical protein
MTTRTTTVDHPSRRLVVALPQAYDEAPPCPAHRRCGRPRNT